MHRTLPLLISASVFAIAAPAAAQDVPPAPATAPQTAAAAPTADEQTNSNEVVVTARKREETLKDVPVAATAVSGDTIEKRGLTSVKDVALLTPGLSINSDGAGRAFVSIRGVGVTLVDSVQPGVGIFLDGIYQPNTSYLNNPLVDVERVEVLRGPQGTLYGKNTLGGAINVITKQPSNVTRGSAIFSYAGPDQSLFAAGSISGPVIKDVLQIRAGYAHREQDGFIDNKEIGKPGNPLRSDTINGTIRFAPGGGDTVLTTNGYYTWLKGGSVPYAFVSGPTDYNRDIFLNATNYQYFQYRGINTKLETPVGGASKLTLIGAYDARDVDTPDADGDFTNIDLLRVSGLDQLRTRTLEARFDSELSPTLSSIFGLFYSRETRKVGRDLLFLSAVTNTEDSSKSADTYAAFGNVFWRPNEAWELSAGVRVDTQKQKIDGSAVANFPNVLLGLPPTTTLTNASLKETNVSPRVALTHHFDRNLMAYVSVARGSRGGGFNPPGLVNTNLAKYTGDNVWTYEAGTKYSSADRRLSLSGAVFYNDYKNYIGLNTIALTTTGSFTTVDLNTGDAKSYGVELEGSFRPVRYWTLTGGVSLQHARLTNFDAYSAATATELDPDGRTLASKRLTFQPDWNFNLNSNVIVPVGEGNEIEWNAGVVGKGSRIAASLSETVAPVLKSYVLANTSLTYRTGNVELTAFVDNLFNKDYFDSYIEKTTLILAGLPATDVGIAGEKRRYGVRTRFRF
ncbi:MAG TPA: TonB-dependent receptor [Sphingomicrobium sp.]|jgi:iron complex outermembrane receptor protein|nr:TonB-dependent receptor [Sphingomicrobium sp.]